MEINDIIDDVKSKKISIAEGASMISSLGYYVKDFQFENDKNVISSVELTSKIEEQLAILISEILQINQKQIDFNDSFMDLGLDSVNIVELTETISNKFNVNLYPTLLFEEQNITALSIYLAKNETQAFVKYFDIEIKNEFPIIEIKNEKKDNQNPINSNKISDSLSQEIKSKNVQDKISVIGMSTIFPGAPSLEMFWNNLLNEINSISIPKNNRKESLQFGLNENSKQLPQAGFIDDIYDFDPLFYKISPTEAEFMDPQQKLLLKAVWSAFENAGYNILDLYTQEVGVFVGSSTNDFMDLMISKNIEVNAYYSTGAVSSILANRISYVFDFKGPSEVIDTACSSSLVALNRAILALKNQECKIAVVAGVNALLTGRLFNSFQKAGMLSKEWQCKTFDEYADGYVRGEGVGCIILKIKSDALKDKDPIYANILNSVVIHGGRSNSLTAPNVNSQVELYRKAYLNKGLDISKLGYIETHGTGTQLGDSIEVNALTKFIQEYTPKNNSKIILGSVKTNIGHLEAASGIAGFIKTCLILSENIIPKNLNFNKINPLLNLKEGKIVLANKTQKWNQYFEQKNKNLAGINSFGFGGTICHIVLEKNDENLMLFHEKKQNNRQVILLSSSSFENVKIYAYHLRKFIENKQDLLLIEDIAYTLQKGRSHLSSRIAFTVSNNKELIEHLQEIENGDFKNIKVNTIKHNNRKESMFDYSQNSINFCKSLLEQNKTELLINQWLIGENVPFSDLYIKETRKVIHLPTNTFSQKNIQHEKKIVSDLDIVQTIDSTIEIVKINESLYKIKISHNSQLVRHHLVQGHLVLPGSAYIEILFQVIKNVNNYNIKEIRWLQPLIFNDEDLELYFNLENNKFKFYSIENSIEKIFVIGEIEHEYLNKSIFNTKYSINQIKNKSKEIYSENLYSHLANLGLNYGNGFKLVKNISINNNKNSILVELKEKNDIGVGKSSFIIDPFLLDASFHGISILLNSVDQSKVPVPYFIKNFRLIKNKVPIAYVYIRNKKNDLSCEMITLDKNGGIISVIDTIKLELIKI